MRISPPQGTKRVANFSESLGMQFAIVHIGEEVDSGGNDNRHPAASLVGNVKVRTPTIHGCTCNVKYDMYIFCTLHYDVLLFKV